ncbi:hypothetical protein [Ectobacillus panaciterrae]|uniref:Ger(x)C family spore germination protein n=1 Tax=Ectobacillus panaciterrae TaxID=363872 RepID=UPI000685AD8A|nr:hypothetical protein [Ectobacillus panaciterrae]
MKRKITSLTIASLLLFLTGCWDQDPLKEARLIYATAMDRAPNGKMIQTVVIREVLPGEQQKVNNEIYSATGNSPRDTTNASRNKIAGHLRHYEEQVYLLGKSIAKTDIYPLLDVIYRDPKNPIYSKLTVVDGKGGDLLKKKK